MSSRIARHIAASVVLIASLQQVSLSQNDNRGGDRKATIESETKARLTLRSELNSKMSEAGDIISATLADPLYVDGQLVLQRGTEFSGRVTKVARAKRVQRSSHISIELDHIVMPSGQVPISAQVVAIDDWDQEVSIKANSKGELKGGHRGDRTINNMQRGASLGLSGGFVGAALGGAAGASGRQVLGIGAAGVAAGMIGGLLLTKGSDLRVRPGVILRIKFNKPVTLPVTSEISNSIH